MSPFWVMGKQVLAYSNKYYVTVRDMALLSSPIDF